MPLTKVGINFTNLGNVTPLNLSIDINPKTMADSVVAKANEVTFNYLGLGVMLTTFMYLIYFFQDELQGFRFSGIRSTAIASIIVSMFGIICTNLGFFTEYYHVVIFIVISAITTIWVLIEER